MNPDQNQNPNQYSIDYLNQIAPEPPKKGMSSRLFVFVIGGALLLAAIVGVLSLFNGSNSPTQKMQTLAARLETLQKISDESQKRIKSGTLRNTNSNLSIFLTNTNRDIVDPFSKNGVNVEKIDKAIATKEDGEKLRSTLEDARLNAVFDRTYAREMNYQLETITGLMKDLYSTTKSSALKKFLENTDANLRPIKEELSSFNNTTE